MELLAPAGNWPAFIAAVHNGADAVYLGGSNFNARQSARNFTREDIKRAVEYAHIRNIKVYLAVNVLIDMQEFEQVLDYVWDIYNAGIDAVIIQDIGLMQAIAAIIPDLKMHASTQMTVHNGEGIMFLMHQGIKRVILAREVSLTEIKTIRQTCPQIELEAFVHGALCYSYSGQCLFSSMIGGRSGNRGNCAQPCRLPYSLMPAGSNSVINTNLEGNYLLSPRDLCLLDHLTDLQDAGVNSLKIEGRMKRPEYVAVVTRVYRETLDALENMRQGETGEGREKLLKIFNRDFSTGHLIPNRREFLSSTRPDNRGVKVGEVLDQNGANITRIKLSEPVNSGDGLEVLDAGGQTATGQFGANYVNGQKTGNADAGSIISIRLNNPVSPGNAVFRTHDEKLLDQARQSQTEDKIRVRVKAILKLDMPMEILFADEDGYNSRVYTASHAQFAEKHPLDEGVLRDKLGRLGHTPFCLEQLDLQADGELIVPLKEINQARREAVEELIAARLHKYQNIPLSRQIFIKKRDRFCQPLCAPGVTTKTRLSISVAGIEEAFCALESGADRVYVALEGMGGHKISWPELQRLLDVNRPDKQVVPALPHINKPGKLIKWESLLDMGADTIMVGNLGALNWALPRFAVRCNYSLNVFNPYSMRMLLNLGVKSACLSPELNYRQLRRFNNIDKVEVLVDGEIILMVSEFCMLRAVLGGDGDKCSRPCENKSYIIRDPKGYRFPVATDSECRFYVFNSRRLCLMDVLDRIVKLKPESIRIEAHRSDCRQIAHDVALYRQALDELMAGAKPDLDNYRRQLLQGNSISFTRGHFKRGII